MSYDGPTMNAPTPPLPPALVAGFRRAVLLSADGATHEMAHAEAAEAIAGLAAPVVCHGPATARRLAIGPFPARDILELFAFVRPAVRACRRSAASPMRSASHGPKRWKTRPGS